MLIFTLTTYILIKGSIINAEMFIILNTSGEAIHIRLYLAVEYDNRQSDEILLLAG